MLVIFFQQLITSYYSNRASRMQKSNKNPTKKQLANHFKDNNSWIGSESPVKTPSIGSTKINSANTQWIYEKSDAKIDTKEQEQTRATFREELGSSRQMTIGNKSAVELMTDLLKGVSGDEKGRKYYSKQLQQLLGELLTNKHKLNSFIKTLENDMVGLDSSIVKNYELLAILLHRVGNADAQIKQSSQGLQIKFNSDLIRRRAVEIQRLKQQNEQSEREAKYLIAEYESVIFNFHDVIQKIISRNQCHRIKY